MGDRPARCYREFDPHAYTRTSRRKQRKSFIKGVPDTKIHIFDIGEPEEQFNTVLDVLSDEDVQIRHNALESTRVVANRVMSKALEKTGKYHIKIMTYPHHVLRENAMVSGAGADRIQKGMKKCFGRPIGRAARVKKGQTILRISVQKEHLPIAKEAAVKALKKLPCTGSFNIIFR